ncbi:hypothetical protein [Paracoccus tibetensis]|uniref:hypothetical protein n=1 Tax=Paracoccus tibetensis TaxID=336292 RepID=UPI000A9A2A85|nr:hypothetical protein [Paracoccus tibetensis]
MAKDEEIYVQVSRDFEAGRINKDLQTKALILSRGDEKAAKYEYIRLRVEQIKSDNLRNLPFKAASKAAGVIQQARDERASAKRAKLEAKQAEAAARRRKAELRRSQHEPNVLKTFLFLMFFALLLWGGHALLTGR